MSVASVGMGALRAAFQVLFDAVMALKEETTMFEPLLGDIKPKLDSLKPLIEEMESHNYPREVLQDFTVQMEEGVNLVQKCRKIGPCSCCRKPKYTNKLHGLDKSLGRLLNVLKMLRDVNETTVSWRNIEMMLHRIEGSLVMQNQPEIVECCSAVPPEPPSFTVGLDVPLKEVKMRLLKDGVSTLVVTAPGGFGKTTLAKMLCHDQEVQDIFKNSILFLNVSKKPNLDLIVQQLYQWNGSKVVNFTNEEVAVRHLQWFLKETRQNPLLFVLDDVWSGSVSLLENFDRFKMSNDKILVTSRFEFRGFGSPYHLEPLNYEDARALFHHSASLEDKSSCSWEDILRKVVERCKGFPLAITVVGRSLCGQPIEIWMKTVNEWSKGSSIFYYETALLDCFQSSLDALDERDGILKKCFMDLASFPENQRIPASALIDMWAELYELAEDILPITKLHELRMRNCASLLLTKNGMMEADGYYTDHFVTQHGILRELAIHQMSKEPIGQRKRLLIDIYEDKLPKWWTEQKYQPLKARLLSISTDGEFSAKWHDMQLPEAEVLVLNFQTKNYLLPEFVEKMDKLKVLIVTHCGHLPAEVANFQLLGSLSNLKRIRLEQVAVPSISKNIKQLKSLQKISLFMCHIGQAFCKGSVQILAALPNLVELNIDYCPDLAELPVGLCDLSELKKLSVTNCHKLSALPKEIGKLVNLEVLRLRSCSDLSELPGSIRNLKKLNFLDISSCLSIKELPEHIGEMYSLEKVNMSQCSRLQELPPSVSNLENLKVVICDEETKDLWEPFVSFLRNIHIKVVKEDINLNWLQRLPS